MINKRLKILRESLGLSQEKIGEKLGIDQSNYSKYEKGKLTIDVILIDKLRELYNLNINWLFTGNGPMLMELDNLGPGWDELPAFSAAYDNADEAEFQTIIDYFEKRPNEKQKIQQIWALQDKYQKNLNKILKKDKKKN